MKLSEIVQRINGNIDRFTTELEFYIGGEHMESSELEISNRGLLKENLGKLGFKFHFAFQERDVLFMARNPHLRKAGMVMFSGLCSDATYVLRSKDENIISQEFLAIQLQTDHFWDYCERTKVGSVNFANNWSSIANYDFDLPPINIQKEVASKVWSAYRVKQSYRKLLNAIDEMVKSQFIEMLSNSGYEEKSMGELCDKITDGSHNPPKGNDGSEYLMISSKNVFIDGLDLADVRYLSKEEFDLENKRTEVKKNNILLTIVGTIGRTYLVKGNEGNIVMQRSVAVLKPSDRVNPLFMMYSLHIDENLEKEGRGNAQKGVYLKQLSQFKIKVPSLDVQNNFCTIYQQADKSKFELKKSIEAIDKVIKSLINNI